MLMVDVKVALKALSATKVRTALTILGIVIGVASITVVLSLGEGAKQKMRSQVGQLGDNLLTVRPGRATRDAKGTIVDYNFWAALGATTIGERDLQTIKKTPGVQQASPLMVVNGSVSGGQGQEPAKNTTIIATDTQFDKVFNLKLRGGEFLNNATDRETVVLGQELAIELLGSDTTIGHKIIIRGQEFTVIGILEHSSMQANLSNFYNFNRTAFIPLDAGKSFNQGIAQIQQINARADKGQDLKAIAKTVQAELIANHGGEEDFTVLRPEESVKVTDSLLKILTTLTSAVASISLIVGGVGIMNVMLVSVTERTREIGIRKAVGATSTQILRQFLIESLIMSSVGGVVGIIAAYSIAFFIGSYLDFLPAITWQTLAIAMSIAMITGIIFGITPAIKAARKDPIEALRFFN